jgi:type II secretory ATPase GspE/PulE/Tfp pilus assembly ATPase PilB-like protein
MPDALARLPESLARSAGLLPLGVIGDVLHVACGQDLAADVRDEVARVAGVVQVHVHEALADRLPAARERAYAAAATRAALTALDDAIARVARSTDPTPEHLPVAAVLDALIAEAVVAGASDLHIEADEDGVRVRMRIDGALRDRARLAPASHAPLVARLKVVSALDIAERRLPQDGRTVVTVARRRVDVRVATLPTWHGESATLRLLPRTTRPPTLASLGLSPGTRAVLDGALARPQGLVLVTGPTGSGKTTTLHAALAGVADATRKVVTLEDPIERALAGANQTQVEPRIGLGFALGLRHALRHDPDVLLVGEVRDAETATLVVEAAFTGHLVLTTLHSVDAPSAVSRLVELGAERALIAPTLLAVVAQRLARRVCRSCARPCRADPGLVERLAIAPAHLEGARLREGAGCPACGGTGVAGRLVIDETIALDPATRRALMATSDATAFDVHLRALVVRSLRADALTHALEGRITLAEALRVSPDPDAPSRHALHPRPRPVAAAPVPSGAPPPPTRR